MSYDVTREELVEAFAAAGKVVDAKLPTDRETGRPRGFAFVEFESDDAAQKCISLMNGRDLKGRPLRVNEAENRPPRPPGERPMGPRPGGGTGGPRPFSPRPSFAGPPPDAPAARGFDDSRGNRRFREKPQKHERPGGGRPAAPKRKGGGATRGGRADDYDDYE